MTSDSEMFEKLAPELAPSDESVAGCSLAGLWSYGDGEMERLVWQQGEADVHELESAIETALWLFDDRREEGDSATISMSDGTVVIERGSESVLAAWYPRVDDDSANRTRADGESDGFGLDANTEAYDRGSPPSELDVEIENEPDTPPSEGAPTRPSSNNLDTLVESVDEEASGAEADAISSGLGSPRTGQAREGECGANHETQERSRSTSSAVDSGEEARESETNDDLAFEIAFVEQQGDGGGPQTSSVSRTRECDWRAVVEHLGALTEIAERHLGRSVVRNYWKEALDERPAVREQLEIDLFDGLQARDPDRPVDREEATELQEVRREWVDRCRRSVPAEAVAFDDAARPPWRTMLEPR